MNTSLLIIAVEHGKMEWLKHAFARMMERGISRAIIKHVLLTGEIIEEYADHKPYPSGLFLGWYAGEPFHVVASLDEEHGLCYVITAYKPDLTHFKEDFKTRRSHGNQNIAG